MNQPNRSWTTILPNTLDLLKSPTGFVYAVEVNAADIDDVEFPPEDGDRPTSVHRDRPTVSVRGEKEEITKLKNDVLFTD